MPWLLFSPCRPPDRDRWRLRKVPTRIAEHCNSFTTAQQKNQRVQRDSLLGVRIGRAFAPAPRRPHRCARVRPHRLSTPIAPMRERQEMPMNWALYRAFCGAPRRSAQCALDLLALPDACGGRARPRSSCSKKFLRILPRNGLSRSPRKKKVRESLLGDSAEAIRSGALRMDGHALRDPFRTLLRVRASP